MPNLANQNPACKRYLLDLPYRTTEARRPAWQARQGRAGLWATCVAGVTKKEKEWVSSCTSFHAAHPSDLFSLVYARSLHLTVLMCNSRADKKKKRALTVYLGWLCWGMGEISTVHTYSRYLNYLCILQSPISVSSLSSWTVRSGRDSNRKPLK